MATQLTIERVYRGWRAPQDGYFMDTLTGQRLTTAWKDTEYQLIQWRSAYKDLKDVAERQAKERAVAYRRLAEQLNRQQRKAQRAKEQALLIGLIGGALISHLASK